MKTTIDFFCIAISYLRRGRGGAVRERESGVMFVCEGAENKILFETERSRCDQSES